MSDERPDPGTEGGQPHDEHDRRVGFESGAWSPWPEGSTSEWWRYVPEPPRRRTRHLRTVAGTLMAVALLLAGMAAGVAVATRPTGTGGPTAQLASNGTATSRDRGVVDVNTILGFDQARAAGTGIVLTSAGEVLTNNHVVQGATSIEVIDVATGRSYVASVVGTDPTADVAVLRLADASGLATARLGSSTELRVGQAVTAVGNAGGVGGVPSESSGAVTALHQQITAGDQTGDSTEQLSDMVETSATLQPGDSGGPLLDGSGRVVGMDTAAGGSSAQGTSENFAIPINRALSVVRLIEAGHSTSTVHVGPTPFLGVEVDPTGTSGAEVSGIVPGTPAAGTGLQQGDVITSIAGVAVTSGSDLSRVLSRFSVGQSVRVTWMTPNGLLQGATITLARGPAA